MKFTGRLAELSRAFSRRVASPRVPACRGVLALMLLPFLCALAGCRDDQPEVTSIRFWNGFTGADGLAMLRIIRQFNAEHPDIEVSMQRMDWRTVYYNKLFVAGLSGRQPEVFVVHVSSYARFQEAGLLRQVDDLLDDDAICRPDRFDDVLLRALDRDGRHYAIPLDVHMHGMYFNRRLFREAGLVDLHGEPRPPATRDEYLDALRRLTRDLDGDGRVDQWGTVIIFGRQFAQTLLAQWGGRPFNQDRTRCRLDAPENAAAMRFLADLTQRDKVMPTPDSYDDVMGWLQGRVGLVFEGPYFHNYYSKVKELDFGVAPIPQFGPRRAMWGDSHLMCLDPNLVGARLAASIKLVRYISDHSLAWAAAGQIPARRDLREDPEFKRLDYMNVFTSQIPDVTFAPQVPYTVEYFSKLDEAVDRIAAGRSSVEESLARATREVQAIVDRHLAARERMEAGRP